MVSERLKRTLFSNVYAQIVTLTIAFLSVPIFLSVWNVEKYGIWLIICSFPAYIITADFGVGSVSINKLVMSRGVASEVKTNTIFHTALALISIVALVISIMATLALVVFLSFSEFPRDYIFSIYLLALLSAISLFNPCIDGAMRAQGFFGESVFVLNSMRLLEWGAGIAVLFITPSFTSVALGMLVARVTLNTSVVYFISRRIKVPSWSYKMFSKEEFLSIIKPAASFSLFPLANAISIQGLIFTVGAFIGPSAVVTFSCYRTISRTVTQGLAVVNKSYWPEFSENYGRQNFTNLTKLFNDCAKLNVLFGICFAVLLLIFGEFIIRTWSRGLVSFDLVFFSVMTAGVVVTGFWQAHWVYLMAINRHSRVSVAFMILSLFMLLISIPLLLLLGVTGAAVAIVIFELSMAISMRSETKKHLRLFQE